MKYYNWIEEINNETFQKFCEFINNNQGEEILLHFQTYGGGQNLSAALLNVINTHVKEIIVTGGVHSGGFYILYYTTVPITLIKGAMGMWHYAIYKDFSVSVKNTQATYTEDIYKIKNNKIYKKICDKLAKRVMTKKELQKFKKDKDVYFVFKRMKQIFPDAKII